CPEVSEICPTATMPSSLFWMRSLSPRKTGTLKSQQASIYTHCMRWHSAGIGGSMTIILLLIGAALIYLIQARLYSHYWRQGLHVAIHFPRQAVVEGENATLVEEITNNKRLPLPILHVKFKISRNLL